MADPEHVQQIKLGKDHWNKWRENHKEIWPDLSEANLSEANLSGANLSEANLHGANLCEAYLAEADLSKSILYGADLAGANLREANLSGANLGYVDLNGANLSEANLHGANLCEACLRHADLEEADLSEVNLSEADLSYASLFRTIIAKTNLQTAKGLTAIVHQGPSYIELFSVHLPQDGSALHFLRGVGVPDEWIDDYRTRMMHPIQYHSCFISYSSKDEILASRLYSDLQAQGVRCWFAPEDLKTGDKFRNRIDEAIHMQDKLLLLLSKHSIASEWVETEVEAALEKERKQKREVLFPTSLDDAVMRTTKAWAATLRRTRHIGDFTKWIDPQAYQIAFQRLLRDLKQS